MFQKVICSLELGMILLEIFKMFFFYYRINEKLRVYLFEML